jgi:hypothetical protein
MWLQSMVLESGVWGPHALPTAKPPGRNLSSRYATFRSLGSAERPRGYGLSQKRSYLHLAAYQASGAASFHIKQLRPWRPLPGGPGAAVRG